ncbi:MAG: hypothetical protein AAFO69_18290, partial [Bacteroidota bacterium]
PFTMKKHIIKYAFHFLWVSIVLVQPLTLLAQMNRLLKPIINDQWDQKSILLPLTESEKLQQLAILLPDDSVQFKDESMDEDNYFLLDPTGLMFLDLNADDNPDLLYSGQSGPLALMDTKLYFQEDGRLKFSKKLDGGIHHIRQSRDSTWVSTLWLPCCGSYTSRISTYLFTKHHDGTLLSTISFIGRIGRNANVQKTSSEAVSFRSSLLLTEGLESVKLDTLRLYGLFPDFRGTSAYFGKNNKDISTLVKAKSPVNLLTYKGVAMAKIIAHQDFENETWLLVLTSPLNEVPKSLYEWSSGDRRRFVGWIRRGDLK